MRNRRIEILCRACRSLAMLVCFGTPLIAQITWSGIYDFEIKKGGKQSKPELNELPNEATQLNIRSFQLFLDAAVDEGVSFSAKVATSRRNGPDARSLDLELAYVTFSGLAGEALNISAGKILTPFGGFVRRQLSPSNPLLGNPFFFYYQTNVSPISGYLDSNGVLLSQSLYGGRASTIYSGGYYLGIEAFGSLAEDLFQYDVALMNAPLASSNSGINLDRQLSFHGRLAVRPAIWGTFGVSLCAGSFLERATVNAFLDSTGGMERFKQQAVGFDLALAYLYYELNAEFIVNRFNAPYIIYDFTINPPYRSGLTGKDDLILSSREVLVDLKIDLPFSPGLYFAARYNAASYDNITDPFTGSATFGKEVPWDHNAQRFALSLGYKLARGVLVKVGHEWTKMEINPRPDLDVFGTQLSVSF